MYKDHPVFKSPQDPNTIIWRYMTFEKFLSLIKDSSLFLVRGDILEDNMEGRYPNKQALEILTNIRIRQVSELDSLLPDLSDPTKLSQDDFKLLEEKIIPLLLKPELSEEEVKDIRERLSLGSGKKLEPEDYKIDRILNCLRKPILYEEESIRNRVCINCWHMNDYESVAMWKIYATMDKGIAIKSTYKSLRDSIIDESREAYIGVIDYFDYDKEEIFRDNVFRLFMTKRKSFEYEKELRVLVYLNWYEKPLGEKKGIFIKVDLNKLIDEIWISSKSTKKRIEEIQSVLNEYNINKGVRFSSIDDRPAR